MHSIEHVVVLMLENRSFDCLLGKLYPKSDRVRRAGGDGKQSLAQAGRHGRAGPGLEQRRGHGRGGLSARSGAGRAVRGRQRAAVRPGRRSGGDRGGPPDMSGFVDNYARQPWPWTPDDPSGIMHYFLPAQVPIISRLALEFGVSDRWHASTPSETWPNRYFAHCGTAGGYVNNSLSRFPYQWPRMMPTIFRRLGKAWLQLENLFPRHPAGRVACSISGPRSRPISASSRRNSSGMPHRPAAELQLYRAALFSDAASRTRCRTTSTRRTICSTASS